MTTGEEYRRAGSGLDEHISGCELCSQGVACPAGDSAAETEFRAWRQWERSDADATRAHRKAGFPW